MTQQEKLNKILFAMLGSEHLVDMWWDSPNRHWNLQTPNEIWNGTREGKTEVIRYILSYASK